jgi:hypothetical protein
MGARSYLPELGIFTATDPVEGGNTTTYAYPQDPINHNDLTGMCDGFWGCLGAGAAAVGKFAYDHADTIAVGVCVFSAGVARGVAGAAAAIVAGHKAYNSCSGCSTGDRWKSAIGSAAVNYATGKIAGIWCGGKVPIITRELSRAKPRFGGYAGRHRSVRRISVKKWGFGIDVESTSGGS